MTRSHRELTTFGAGLEQLRQSLEKFGWRFTRQRAAVFEFLHTSHSHPTAEEVYAAVRRRLPHISLGTVYKALDALVDCRLAVKLADAEGPARYDGRCDAHYHLRCLRTGRVDDLPTPFDPNLLDKLDDQLVDTLHRQGFQVLGYRLELLGEFQEN